MIRSVLDARGVSPYDDAHCMTLVNMGKQDEHDSRARMGAALQNLSDNLNKQADRDAAATRSMMPMQVDVYHHGY